jgi:hypothetical protein
MSSCIGGILIFLGLATGAGRISTACATITTGYIDVLAGRSPPLTIESSTGKKCADGDDRPDNNCFKHVQFAPLLDAPNSLGKK